MKSNSSLLLTIFISYFILQNQSIKNILLSRFESFNIPYLNIIILALVQVTIVFLFKNFI